MPERATSRGLLFGGAALVMVAAALMAIPVLRDRAEAAHAQLAGNDELQRLAAAVIGVRDALDSLHEARAAQRDYLVSGAAADRAEYAARVETARERVARLGIAALPGLDWERFSALTVRLLRALDDGVALRDAREVAAAVAASRIGEGRALMDEVDGIVHAGVRGLQERQAAVMDGMLEAGDAGEQFGRALFAAGGVCFALGGIALLAYQRRRTLAERRLRSGRDAALAASQLKTRFVATASHDLRQPLHAISMFVGVLRRRAADPAMREVVENMATAVASMQRMFAALLDVARLDAGAIQPVAGLVRLQELYDALKVEFAPTAAARGLSLQIAPTQLAVSSDAALLETILRNLLSNAVKFCDSGAVGIVSRRQGAAVDITVFDTGIGIAPDDQQRVFEQFERALPAGAAREGLGLGLSIVRRMAELLGTRVTLASQPGLGSRFTLSLPHAAASSVPPRPAARRAELEGARILVLDDHDEARRAIALAVAALGGVASEAGSAAAARGLAAALPPGALRAAIVDHDLGGGATGPQFLDEWRAAGGPDLPAVVVTGSTDAATLAGLRAAGRPWLIKPVDLDVLGPLLARLVAGAREAAPPR